jgi:mono/diheme cytochrome c family protein
MKRLKEITPTFLFAAHVLLVFLLIFQGKVHLPMWMQPLGRMHPMLLHVPIGLLVLTGLLWWAKKEFDRAAIQTVLDAVLSLTAITAVTTALLGFFLSREGGYPDGLLQKHLWSGVALSFFTYGLAIYNEQLQIKPQRMGYAVTLSIAVLLLTGHWGASLTHGEDYLFPQAEQSKEQVITKQSPVFVAAVEPILRAKCYSCHNDQKLKGGLNMTSIENLQRGGKHGAIWVPKNAAKSHLIERIQLGMEEKKHMPPKGKPQLTTEESRLIFAWIQSGADYSKRLTDLPATDSLKKLAEPFFNKNTQAVIAPPRVYDLPFAADKTIEKLNTPFRIVAPIATGSPALQVDFLARKAYEPQQLSELSAISGQLVSLDLSNMPIKDSDVKTLAQFKVLEKLWINNSDLTGATLGELKTCTHLKTLGLSGTQVDKKIFDVLGQMPSLQEVYVWNTKITPAEIAAFQKSHKKPHFRSGYIPNDSLRLQLNPPTLVNEDFVLNNKTPVVFKHSLRGALIRYTINGVDPDTTSSPVFSKPIFLNGYTEVKARATKDQWIASSVVSYTFFRGKIHADSAAILSLPEPEYPGTGAKTLINHKKGLIENFKDTAWLGYRHRPLIGLFFFKQPQTIQSLTLSLGINIGSYIFPPLEVQIWGGSSASKLQLLKTLKPKQPADYEPNRMLGIQADLPKDSKFQVIKIVAKPVPKLPSWHSGKGDLGWVMIDEVFFN